MRMLLFVATILQIAAVLYCAVLLRRHRRAATAWMFLLGTLLSMLVWRIVVSTGATPSLLFNTSIAIWGSVCAVLAMFFFGREAIRRERAEADRDRLLASERTARGDAERASRIKDDFMATLSHELRTPLAAMLGWCAILRKSDLSRDTARAVDTIERNARTLTRLVDDLLDATRMLSGSLHLELSPTPLDLPVLAAIEGVKPMADAKQLQIRYACTTPVPVVMGDPGRLQQVASNLLVNAVKFSPAGTVIDATIRAEGQQAQVTIADQGIGIDPAFKPHLFQRFSQADRGSARRHGGLGLGLSIVSRLTELHHGEVRAYSDGPGTGATFTVTLPLSTATSAHPPREDVHGHEALANAQASLEGIRAMVVDDEPDVLSAVAGLLKQAGAAVVALDSGAGVADALMRFCPDVVILDLGMAGEDGYALIQRIRRMTPAHGGRVPAIALTAHANTADRVRALAIGFQAHLSKPVHVGQLIATILDLAGRGPDVAPPGSADASAASQGRSTTH